PSSPRPSTDSSAVPISSCRSGSRVPLSPVLRLGVAGINLLSVSQTSNAGTAPFAAQKTGRRSMHLALHGVLACTFLLAGAQPASASLHRRRDPIQCCHTRASGATRCRVKTPRACRRYGGIDMGPGTCHPNPCRGAAATLPTSGPTTTSSSTTTDPSSTTSTTVPPCGTFLLKWGAPLGAGNGELNSPTGVATDGSGNVYVADTGNHRIQKFDAGGTFLTAWGSEGSGDGQFGPTSPHGVATAGSGNVYVSDPGNSRIQQSAASGAFLAGGGSGGGGDGQLVGPCGVAIDGGGNVYVTDDGNRVQKFDASGTFLTGWG